MQLQSRIGAPFSGIPPPMVGNYSDQWIVVKATVRPKLYEIGVVTSKGVCSLGEAVLDVSQVVWQCYHIPSTQRTPDPFLGTIAFKRTLSRQEFKSELGRKLPFHFQVWSFQQGGARIREHRQCQHFKPSHQDNANLPSTASQLSMGNPVPARVLLSTRVILRSLLWLPQTMSGEMGEERKSVLGERDRWPKAAIVTLPRVNLKRLGEMGLVAANTGHY
ncbi:hypothetical protein DFH05DRAFT_1456458 [Lentinula detonsa]|uniref:Uncharacterized protein n=1 Tax=Lentinula detonsa TaxID=2804962 RepID=A0A9W8P7J2_9AGAR|nr:hypothetical protein DFH05DRAFT_1456458 [Lentinula detonsa]